VGLALTRSAAPGWDSQKLATGSVMAWQGRFWMAYTGLQAVDGYWISRVGMSVSDDLYTWQKLPHNPLAEPDGVLYDKAGDGIKRAGCWRDPFLLAGNEQFYFVICARQPDEATQPAGVVGLASSPDMARWQLEAPLLVDKFAKELEVPQIYGINGRYYLLFCTTAAWILPEIKQQYPDHQFRNSDYVMVSKSPLGPYKLMGPGDVHPAEQAIVPYASQLVQWQGTWYLLGTVVQSVRGVGDDYVTDPIAIEADEFGLRVVGEK
jgi:beta-fructofuranosidase